MYLLIVFLPLLGFLIASTAGRFIGKTGAQLITTSCLFLSACLSTVAFYEVGLLGYPCHVQLANWIDSELFNISWGFLFDSLTVVMLIVVTYVSFLVHFYSIGYMSEDPHVPRFMSYLSLFTFFMLILVTGDNFVQMFVGWEGVGLCSYLLIGFWYTRLQANKAALKAMIVNRIGDFGLSLGIICIFYLYKSADFNLVFALTPAYTDASISILGMEFNTITLICLLLFVGAVGKSAQLGLHTWLPDAMEGPTPVSALIHAATMVTAGVFMISRCSPLYEYSPTALLVVCFVGAMTAFFAATTGLVQNDLKRVIAYSTCSQLGYMVFACGLSGYSVAMFHLMNHAFFKALLFLSAGAVIHALSDEQDMRKMGGLTKVLPFTYCMILVGSLSLMGFPFLTGFYSKDVILELSFAHYTIDGTFAHWLGTISACFTAFYSFRLIYLTFIAESNAYRTVVSHAHDAPFVMAFPLFLLSLGSVFVGYLSRDLIIGLGTNFWNNSLFVSFEHNNAIDAEFIPYSIKLLPVFLSILGAITALILNHYFAVYLYRIKLSNIGNLFYRFLNRRWYFDKVYNQVLVLPLFSFGYNTTFKLLDKGIIELFGPYGLSNLMLSFSAKVSRWQTGLLYHSGFVMVIGLVFCVGFISFWHYLGEWIDSRLYLLSVVVLCYYTVVSAK